MGNLTAIIAADTTGFKKSVEEAKRVLNKFNDAEDEAAKRLKEVNHISDSQVAAFQRVQKTLQKVSSGAMSTAQAEKALSNQVKELRIQYANLSTTAKNSEFGKALQNQCKDAEKYLGQLRQQLESVKEGTKEVSKETQTSSNSFDSAIGFLKKYAAQLAIATAALNTIKDAFFSSEQNIDDWGRTVSASEAAYRTFCTSLNSGNWSNFFSNLNDAIGGAIELYNTLDRLGSIKTNNQVGIALAEAELSKLRLLKQEGKNVDKQIAEAQQKLSRLKGQEVEQGKKAGRDIIIQAIKTQNGNVNDVDAAKMADELITKNQAAFDFYERRMNEIKATAMDWDYVYDDMGNIVSKNLVFNEKLLSKADKARYDAYKAFIDAETPIGEGLKLYADAVNKESQLAMEQFKYNRWTGATGKGASIQSPDQSLDLNITPVFAPGRTEAQIKKEISELQKKIENTPAGALRIKLIADKEELETELKNFNKSQLQLSLDQSAKNMDLSGVQNAQRGMIEHQADFNNALSQTSSIINSMGSLFGNMGESGVDAFFSILQAAIPLISALSALSVAEGTEKAVRSSQNYVEAIAAVAATVGAIVAALSQKDKFATGGIVGGNSYTGDRQTVRVNSGEMILNKQQQANLFNMINSGGTNNLSGGSVKFKVEGKDLVGVLNNYSKSQSRII